MSTSLDSPSGLRASITSTAALEALSTGDLVIGLYPGTELEGGPTQIYLRLRGADPAHTPLIGPQAPGRLREGGDFTVDGTWQDIDYTVQLVLAEGGTAWFWHVALANRGPTVSVDLICTHDIGLSSLGMLRSNEYYVSQYLDHTGLYHPDHGWAVATRNNLGHGGRVPWSLVGSLGKAVGYATDALDFHGLALRTGTALPGLVGDRLPTRRLQHEHALAVIQDEIVTLEAGATTQRGFFGLLVAHHPDATGPSDVAQVDFALSMPEAAHSVVMEPMRGEPISTLFANGSPLVVRELRDDEIEARWGTDLRHIEEHEGVREAFFTATGRHVVLKHKEVRVLRPHGHILRTGDNIVPDESQLTLTCYMDGFQGLQLTEGHVGLNKVLSTRRSYLGLQKAAGLRIFIDIDGEWQLLDLPSAFEMSLNSATWIYATERSTVTVALRAATAAPEISMTISQEGARTRLLLALHSALAGDDGFAAVPAIIEADEAGFSLVAPRDRQLGSFRFDISAPFEVSNDAVLFSDATSRDLPWVTVLVEPTESFTMRMTGNLLPEQELAAAAAKVLRIAPAADEEQYASTLLNGLRMADATDPDVARLGSMIPWYAHNALIHYLSPRGLEQYNGGGWGTRDICQGPVELLLALGHHEPIGRLLELVFTAQNDHGGWPQAFAFFARNPFRHADDDPHGDVHFWPLLALGHYLLASGDADFLQHRVPFHVRGGGEAEGTILDHVERAVSYINARLIPGTMLESYGHGDWNDSLQPADSSMTNTLVSSWTVTLHYQMLRTLADALDLVGHSRLAADYRGQAEAVLAGFQSLIVDDVLPGYVSYRDPDKLDYLVHPRDSRSGLRYSLLPIIHAIINDMLSPEQAQAHKTILEQFLVGPDGARLFDRPPIYRGGPMQIFQRAESASFFGREIGIMYTHAHLRYAEAMARYGDAEAFFLALRQAIPLGYQLAVPNGRARQSNCYFSSSDAVVADRYEALDHYDRIMDGTIGVEGGWRIYSSGAGIAVRLVHECLLGIKRGNVDTLIDPVMPTRLDGLQVLLTISGRPVLITYRVRGNGCGVSGLEVNGTAVQGEALSNPYRPAGVRVATERLAELLNGEDNRMTISVG